MLRKPGGGFETLHNFTLLALAESAAAVCALALFLLPPGFLFGWFTDLLDFREACASEKLLLSLTFSLAITPTAAVLLEHFAGVRTALALFLVGALISVVILTKHWRQIFGFRSVPRSTRLALLIMAIWAVVALCIVVDWQVGQRLYISPTIYDHSIRVPFVQAVLRDGVPPHNPFFNVGESPVLRYYYYWYVIAALPAQLFGIPARACLNASIVWAGFALAALVPLFLKHFFAEHTRLREKSLWGIGLLAATGLDLIPYIAFTAYDHILVSDMEWWDPNQVTSWFASLLWVPHHVGALIACMAGLLALRPSENPVSRNKRAAAAVLAAMAFASAAGLSLYVTFSFGLFCALWMLVLALQRRTAELLTWMAASLLSFVFAAPFLRELLTKTSGAGSRFAVFAIRDFPLANELLQKIGIHNQAVLDFANIPEIALVYFLEFGFFLLVGVLMFKRELLGNDRLSRPQLCAWILLASCLFIVTIFKSDTTGSNDLGFRGILPVQFVLLLWAAVVVPDLLRKRTGSGLWRGMVISTLAIGILGTLTELVLLRGFAPYVEARQLPRIEAFLQMPEPSRHAYFLQQGFSELDRQLPRHAAYQVDTTSPALWFIHLYGQHSFAAGDSSCETDFGGDPAICAQAMPLLNALYRAPIAPADLDSICDRYQLRALIATDLDPVWRDARSWVWQRTPLVANEMMRALPCGTASQ